MNISVLFIISLTVLLSAPAIGGDRLPVKTLGVVSKAASGTLTKKADFSPNVMDLSELPDKIMAIINNFVEKTQNDIQDMITNIRNGISGTDSILGITKFVGIIIREYGSFITKLQKNVADMIAELLAALSLSKQMIPVEDLKTALESINRTAIENVEKAEMLLKCFNRTLMADKKP